VHGSWVVYSVAASAPFVVVGCPGTGKMTMAEKTPQQLQTGTVEE
jgi:adenylate kinase